MSIPYSGTLKRSAGVISAIFKQAKLLNLKPVKRITIKFDPFHENAVTAREFMYFMSFKWIRKTNYSCNFKYDVCCDRSEPTIDIVLKDSSNVKFLSNNLTVLELLQLFNKHISSLVKAEVGLPQKATIPSKKFK